MPADNTTVFRLRWDSFQIFCPTGVSLCTDGGEVHCGGVDFVLFVPFSALKLVIGWQKGHLVHKIHVLLINSCMPNFTPVCPWTGVWDPTSSFKALKRTQSTYPNQWPGLILCSSIIGHLTEGCCSFHTISSAPVLFKVSYIILVNIFNL